MKSIFQLDKPAVSRLCLQFQRLFVVLKLSMERQAVQRAKEAFLSGRTRPLEFRLQQLHALQRMITEKEAEISTALKQDINRSQYDTPLLELIGIENEIKLALEKLAVWAAPRPVERNLLTISDEVYIQPEPLGLVLIIGAWNYPWAVTLQPLVGAIAAGNAAVVKPSELSEHSSLLLRALLPRYLDKVRTPELFQKGFIMSLVTTFR
uniref:Aldehyde dehydrogenase 3 family, member A1 n=1 Tax=Cyclopterus lumpus TaxID=8103 RepID=A0A8C2XFA4_CYCLU